MSPSLATEDLEAPATLRSPPSTLRVRDHVPHVEVTACPEPAIPAAAPRPRLESGEFALASEPSTRRWSRVA